ncbi:uncharacterized protein LOC125763918 isoform X2 [Anopheles funestus]|uniref:uncharacterized protein LOC125763918 isoform X2 n=1 Tax=Anopheles funestus TaxID=62324 RepID=UPI0020C5F945|nr:uncharacterized protein LOC125763918 isoform X2 [Anopheles funestus]
MENHHSGIKSSATESGWQTAANTSNQSLELSNASCNVEMEQSKGVSTCSNVAQQNTGSFVESVDSSGTIVTSSCVSAESRVASTYHHSQTQSVSLVKNTEKFKRTESAVPGSGSACWALIEWETSNEEPSSYTVIDSSQIVEISRENNRSDEENRRRMRDSGLYTGKLIHVLRGRYIMPATIVIISEDRKFLETELHELRMMAANNLIAKSVTPTQTYREQRMLQPYGRPSQSGAMQTKQNTTPTSPENTNSSKRPRCDSGSSSSIKEIESKVSSASAQESVKEEDFSYQKALPPLRSMVARFNRNDPAPKQAPPMTFDQQTQTTGLSSDVTASNDANFVRIMSYLESIMAEQKGYRMESEYNRRLLHELQENICHQHETLRNVQKQVTAMKQTNPTENPEWQSKQSSTSDLMVAEIVGGYSPEPGVGTNTMLIDSYETTSKDHIVLNHVTDSNIKWETEQEQQGCNSNQRSNTNNQIDDLATRNSTTIHFMDKSTKVSSEASMFIELKNQDETVGLSKDQSRSNSATTVQELINNDWDDSMQETESNNNQKKTVPNTTMVAIGSNNTMVSKAVLENIRWVSYKFATRKVLQAVFSREVLATHSLSGRPCPVHASDVEKPVKCRLDPKMVADVIELIRKRFNVDESHVRAVITNKCADENKMLRKNNGTVTQSGKTKPGVTRTRKTRDKENVSSVQTEICLN